MKKIVVPICIIGLMLVFSGLSVSATTTVNKINFNNSSMPQATNKAVTNLTVNETWDMLTNAGDGIQFYIDVRRNDEWMAERIDTPLPEHPRHYNLHLLQDATLLEKFMSLYGNVDTLIIGCKSGGRSWKAANIILNAGYTGNIYNMIGGLLGWKAAGRPTVVQGGLYNITADEVWELCTDTGNGIQIPIDVRRDDEWNEGYIDTPYPECPVWYCKDLLETEEGLEEFIRTYEGNEIIMYCKGGYRSLLSSYLVMDGDFNGTIYNMLGGITDWIAQGHPIRNNTKPDAPTVNGPSKAGPNVELEYNLSTADAEGDAVSYIIDWGDNTTTETELYAINVECVVTHNYSAKKTYTIIAKAVDFYGNESDPTNFVVKIPRTRTNNFNLMNWLFERFPILRQILGL
jgi:rhodanese-related sulfurtransferase